MQRYIFPPNNIKRQGLRKDCHRIKLQEIVFVNILSKPTSILPLYSLRYNSIILI
jgi:hypothetical protein